MSDSKAARYDVYKPLASGKWAFLFSADSVKKEGGAIEMLEDVITTGPDARVAVVYDTKKKCHVTIFRMNIKDRTVFQPLAGGWREGDGSILANTVSGELTTMAKAINLDLAQQHSEAVPVDDTPELATSEYDYEGQPDYAILHWLTSEAVLERYVIPRPTEKQLRVLTLTNSLFINASNTPKQDAALMRISCALCEEQNRHYFNDLLKIDKAYDRWLCIWSAYKMESSEDAIRIENSTVEIFYSGCLE